MNRPLARTTMTIAATLLALTLGGCGQKNDDQEGLKKGSGENAAPTNSQNPEEPTPTGQTPGEAGPVPVGTDLPLPTATGGFDKPGDFGSGMSARIAKMDSVQVKAREPGEVSGDAVAFTVEFKNGGGQDVNLENVTVSCQYSGQEASSFNGPPAAPAPGTVKGNSSATGVYVFGIPKENRDKVQLTVSYAGDKPMLVFTGSAPK